MRERLLRAAGKAQGTLPEQAFLRGFVRRRDTSRTNRQPGKQKMNSAVSPNFHSRRPERSHAWPGSLRAFLAQLPSEFRGCSQLLHFKGFAYLLIFHVPRPSHLPRGETFQIDGEPQPQPHSRGFKSAACLTATHTGNQLFHSDSIRSPNVVLHFLSSVAKGGQTHGHSPPLY